jgi:hypothetical protein
MCKCRNLYQRTVNDDCGATSAVFTQVIRHSRYNWLEINTAASNITVECDMGNQRVITAVELMAVEQLHR